ncbi:MAG: helix-hairpin-helix domain-containing protein [Chloroflexota bacterium]|nr:helix-hairpin-helix domain-containing protein [Chloroflexota bacterium]MBI5702005.1 helix-hairpin-helix domain-containing protein [Chloroflexota bacterium]
MTDFLQFLNTADLEALTQLPGISPSVAENLIAARPFSSIEDVLKVRGIGKNLLARAQAAFEKMDSEKPPQPTSLSPVETQTPPAPPEETPPPAKTPQASEQTSFGTRLGRAFVWFLRAVLRLLLMVLVIGGGVVIIYYGVPFINDRIIAPLEQNTYRIRELENRVTTLQTQLDELNRQLETANQEIARLNEQQVNENDRLAALEKAIEAYTADLAKLEEMQTALETAIQETNEKTLQELKQEVILTRILDTLARARLYLAQSNFGLAKADVQSARDLLADLQAETQDTTQRQALERLDLALTNLPAFPVVASGDLEIAWQLLMTGQPMETAATETPPPPTPAPETTPSVTPTP